MIDAFLSGVALTHRDRKIAEEFEAVAHGRCSVEHEVHIDHIIDSKSFALQNHLVEDKSSWANLTKPFANVDGSCRLKRVNFKDGEKVAADPVVQFVRAIEKRMEQLAEFLFEQTNYV